MPKPKRLGGATGGSKCMSKSMQNLGRAKETDVSAPHVSVIIPLYYAEEYVDALLTQLRTQPLENIEIICVIDGSPDATLDIVKKHAEADSRMQWIYQENAGAGAARNAGLALAAGEYLSFIDADDLYDAQFLTKMYEAAKKHDADLVVCQFKHVDCKTGAIEQNDGFRPDRVPTDTVFASQDLTNPFSDIFVGPINKLYRREMVEKEGLRFSTTMVANDNFFVLCSIVSAQRIVAIQDSLIEVRRFVNSNSVSSNRARHTEDMFTSFQDLYAWLVQHGLYEQYHSYYVKAWTDAFHYNATYDRNERFVETAARILACEEPWTSMDDKELQRETRLDTGFIRLKKLILARQPDTDARALELRRSENEEAVVQDVVSILNTQYGKKLSERSSIVSGAVTHLKNNGIRHSAARFASRIKRG